jgi:riboflavin biosynthesis pyrimidine reductase
MRSQKISFEPLTIFHNTREDEWLRKTRRTIWGDLSPDPEGAERAEHDQVPYTYALFIQSKDGKVTDSLKGGVGRMAGQPADRFGQLELRATVDAFLVGAGTLRADKTVGAPVEEELLKRRRIEKGNIAPYNVFFSASGDFPADAPVFSIPDMKTALFLPRSAEDKVEELQHLTSDIHVVSDYSPVRDTWNELWRRGVSTIGFEGGPRLMGQALREGLVHELLLTHSPLILGGAAFSFAAIAEPIKGMRAEPIFLGYDPSSHLLFERSRIIRE